MQNTTLDQPRGKLYKIMAMPNDLKCIKRTPKSVTRILAPLQPIGCPNDTPPPCTFSLSCSSVYFVR